ncbi:MAG: glycosyltransferase [Bacteroidia bacterium]|nr:glycosyltransferase [Bacteroidia bacterium]
MNLPNVGMIGEVENAIDFMNSKSIMVVPLLSGSGMRIKIIEGLALEKAIVTTSIGAEGINYEDGKNLLIANNPNEFVTQIERLITDKELVNNLGANARKLIEIEYSNIKLVENLVEEYKKMES